MSKVKTQDHSTVVTSTIKAASETPKASVNSNKSKTFQGIPFLFDKQNYMFMAIGLVIIILGYILMSGGRSADPNVFDADAIYSFRRITLAPILIIIGLAIEGYAIMKQPANTKS